MLRSKPGRVAPTNAGMGTSGRPAASRLALTIALAAAFLFSLAPPFLYTHWYKFWPEWRRASLGSLKLDLGNYEILSRCQRMNVLRKRAGLEELKLILEVKAEQLVLAEERLLSTRVFWSRERSVARYAIDAKVDEMTSDRIAEWQLPCTNWLEYRRKLSEIVASMRL